MSTCLLSPTTVARQLGLRDATIYSLIRRGELRAVDLAAKRGGRPRFRIPAEAIEEFLLKRTVTPAVKQARRRKPERPANWVSYFGT